MLTTLGVYIGLLVVGGAAPQVFAHSATTRVFEITEEIEVKDDLDLDPEKASLLLPGKTDKDLTDFAIAYANFLLGEYEGEIEFSKKLKQDCPDGCRFSYLGYYSTFSPELEKFLSVRDYSGHLAFSPKEFKYEMEIKFSPSHKQLFDLETAFAAFTEQENGLTAAQLLIIRSTGLSVDPKSLYLAVVTRLPRAALDELLAISAK